MKISLGSNDIQVHIERCKQDLNLALLRHEAIILPLKLVVSALDFVYFLFIFSIP